MRCAEDFAFFLEKKPGAYICIGDGTAETGGMPHSPHYDFNDAILPLGASYGWARRNGAGKGICIGSFAMNLFRPDCAQGWS